MNVFCKSGRVSTDYDVLRRSVFFFLWLSMEILQSSPSRYLDGQWQRIDAKLIDLRRCTFAFRYSVFKRNGLSGPRQSLLDSRGIWIRLWAPTRGAPTLGCSEVTVSTQLCTPQTTGVPAADSITRIWRRFAGLFRMCIPDSVWERSGGESAPAVAGVVYRLWARRSAGAWSGRTVESVSWGGCEGRHMAGT